MYVNKILLAIKFKVMQKHLFLVVLLGHLLST